MTLGPRFARLRDFGRRHPSWLAWIGWMLLFAAAVLLGLPVLYAAALAALPWLL